MTDDPKKQILAILYASGEPVSPERIAEALETEAAQVKRAVRELAAELETQQSPLEILCLESSFQLATRPSYAPVIRRALEIRRNQPLSQAAMEALAIIAYNQPATRGFVEQVRGVDSSGLVSSLAEKGLIEEAGRLELPGRPIAFRTTANFLRTFNLQCLDELPMPPQEEADGETQEEKDELEDAPDRSDLLAVR
jgi:segregation and condensation protein B